MLDHAEDGNALMDIHIQGGALFYGFRDPFPLLGWHHFFVTGVQPFLHLSHGIGIVGQ